MIIYQDKNIIVRTIEDRDCQDYLKLFDEEDFGCIGINEDQKPSVYETKKFLQSVIDKATIDEEVLVLESMREFVGYVTVSRPHRNQYHIGSIAVRREKRKQGYGTLLLDIVKELAQRDNCHVKLECINESFGYFKNQGFKNSRGFNFIYEESKNQVQRSSIENNLIKPIFVDYSIIKEERQRREEEELSKERESFQKFLKSPLFDYFNNL